VSASHAANCLIAPIIVLRQSLFVPESRQLPLGRLFQQPPHR
jgi:hypothetical protein